MAINRPVFFDVMRKRFGALTQGQVSGTLALLDQWESKWRLKTPITQFAYCLGTTWHETAKRMLPIKEFGNDAYFFRMYDPNGSRPRVAGQLGNTRPGDGVKFCGRGYVQLTGRANYRKATVKLAAQGLIGPNIDFEVQPDLVMNPAYAAQILFAGMEEGWFTSRKLDALIDPNIDGDEHADFIRARAIINGSDRDELIAKHSDDFLAALIAADRAAITTAPPPDIVPVPKPKPKLPEASKKMQGAGVGLLGLLAMFIGWMSDHWYVIAAAFVAVIVGGVLWLGRKGD